MRKHLTVWFIALMLAGCREPIEPVRVVGAENLTLRTDAALDDNGAVVTIDHQVAHVSTVPTNEGSTSDSGTPLKVLGQQ